MRWHLSLHVVLSATLIALSASTGVAAAQFLDPLGATVSVSDAEPQTPEPRLYRVYETPEQLTLLLTLINRSSQDVFVDQTRFERVRFTVNRDGRSVSIAARWNRDARQVGFDAPLAVSTGGSIRIDPTN